MDQRASGSARIRAWAQKLASDRGPVAREASPCAAKPARTWRAICSAVGGLSLAKPSHSPRGPAMPSCLSIVRPTRPAATTTSSSIEWRSGASCEASMVTTSTIATPTSRSWAIERGSAPSAWTAEMIRMQAKMTNAISTGVIRSRPSR